MLEINGESTSMVWPTLGSRTAKEQNRTEQNTGRKIFDGYLVTSRKRYTTGAYIVKTLIIVT